MLMPTYLLLHLHRVCVPNCNVSPLLLLPAVYEMIETLLPEARIAATSGTAPRLLELAFAAPPAGRPARPGWVKVAQQGGTPVPGDGAGAATDSGAALR